MRDIIRAHTCTDAWLQAVSHLRVQQGLRDYNLVLEIKRPLELAPHEKAIAAVVNDFLVENDKHSVNTVVNTIFPASLYRKHGAAGLYERYHKIVPQLRNHPDTKWGTYFLRMTNRIGDDVNGVRPLEYLIEKLRRQCEVTAPKRAVYELNLIDPLTDIPIYNNGSDKGYQMGGPCLSHISFKLKSDKTLILTALYRSHYYLERALGNFYGLALLQDFVAKEAGIEAAELVCHSTMAVLDTENIKKRDVMTMLDTCIRLQENNLPAATKE